MKYNYTFQNMFKWVKSYPGKNEISFILKRTCNIKDLHEKYNNTSCNNAESYRYNERNHVLKLPVELAI